MVDERGTRAVRIANCSGFYGDRLSAAREMVDGGPIDVLTGDYLAELTMLILAKAKARRADAGYAATFITQAEQVLATCIERGVRIVVNAGGINPAGCAEAVRAVAARLGVPARVAHIEGDDLLPAIGALRPELSHMDTGADLTEEAAGRVVSANAYLGGWGIARALAEGADVVICPRVTDAALVVGAAAWWWDWSLDDWDALAGAVVAGHIIECGAQATGGNYAFFTEIPDLAAPLGFPIAELDRDGSSVITKHPGTGGLVSVGTVTAQLLYEIGDVLYANPDVVARFDTIALAQEGKDRVRVSGTKGLPAPPTTKVCLNLDGGYRNRMTFVLTGLEQERKAQWVRTTLEQRFGGAATFDAFDVRFVSAPFDAPTQEQASGRLHVHAKSHNERAVGRAFSSAVVELALASYPGFFTTTPPSEAQAFGVYWPALVPNDAIEHTVVLDDGRRITIAPSTASPIAPEPTALPDLPTPAGPAAGEPLGTYFAARSGDKGGNANLGIWARDAAGYAWLAENLSAQRLRDLLPEAAGLEVRRYELPNLHALNFVLVGYLGEGVASTTVFDAQAKGLGEYVRSRRWPG